MAKAKKTVETVETVETANRITQVDPVAAQLAGLLTPVVREVVQKELAGTMCTVSLETLEEGEVVKIATRVAAILDAKFNLEKLADRVARVLADRQAPVPPPKRVKVKEPK